jgi:mannose-6-phosphate isomerase
MDAAVVYLLDNPILNYGWGSRTAIAEFLGRPNAGDRPEAELWIGAHPKAPSRVVDPPGLGTLDRAIQADPARLLGPEVCDRFGNELPFLLKVLAAAEPLSIQAHPDQAQALRGWTRENEEGVPLDAPHRNYRDPNHKPELVCALTPFVALKGFRPLDDIARNLEPLARPQLAPEIARLARERAAGALRSLFARLMTLDPEEKTPLLRRALSEAERRAPRDPAWAWVARLQAKYPEDVGVLSPLYLNLVALVPDQALYLAAGELHAYLEGTALELMANSDNVLRGGLTPKHVDVPELLATLAFEAHTPEILRPVESAPGELTYRTPAREFELGMLRITAGEPHSSDPARGVEVLLGLEGSALLRAGEQELPLGRGQALFVPAAVPSYVIGGEGRVCRARVPA